MGPVRWEFNHNKKRNAALELKRGEGRGAREERAGVGEWRVASARDVIKEQPHHLSFIIFSSFIFHLNHNSVGNHVSISLDILSYTWRLFRISLLSLSLSFRIALCALIFLFDRSTDNNHCRAAAFRHIEAAEQTRQQ